MKANAAVLDAHIKEAEAELKAAKAAVEAQQSRLDKLREQQQRRTEAENEYWDELDATLDTMETDGLHIWQSNETIQELSSQFDRDQETVFNDLKERAAAQDRDLTTHHFMRADDARLLDEDRRPITEEVSNGDD